jgi:hypothetical protein
MNETTQTRRLPMVPGPGQAQQRPQMVTQVKENGGAPVAQTLRPPLFQIGPVGDIAKAISSVMTQVGTIEKRGINKFHGYPYARMEDVLHAITPLMGKAGLAVMQNEIEVQNIENNRIRIIYEFTLLHEGGQTLPPVRQSGTAMARDSKGNFDDKCFAKAHTNARKYYLLSLFQLPAGDFPDPDDDDANQRPASRPVPGPSAAPKKEASAAPAGEQISERLKENVSASAADPADLLPHKLQLPQGTTADGWANAYIRCIGKAKTVEEIKAWDNTNDDTLQRISDRYSAIYDIIKAAVDTKVAELSGQSPMPGLPDPKKDPQEAMNWIAGQLTSFKTYEAAEAFWNQVVAPHEKEFDEVDWGMLLGEWSRTERRLAPIEEGQTEQQ